LRISIIGAGRVGRALGKAAALAGHEIGDVVCQSRASALAAVRFIGEGHAQPSSTAVLAPASLILIAVQDDRIPEVVELILRQSTSPTESARSSVRIGRRGVPTALHTSGAISSQALAPLEPAGYAIGSCHPLQTFESPRRALQSLLGSYYCIEGDARAIRIARMFVKSIGGRSFAIQTGKKALYHAGAVLASGGLTALLSISLEILGRCGLGDKEARTVLFPLVEGTIDNIKSLGPARAMTGPIRRRDIGTVRLNAQALAGANPDWAAIYDLLARRSLSLLS